MTLVKLIINSKLQICKVSAKNSVPQKSRYCTLNPTQLDGAVAVDLDERIAGWKLGTVESVAIEAAEVWELLDGVVVY